MELMYAFCEFINTVTACCVIESFNRPIKLHDTRVIIARLSSDFISYSVDKTHENQKTNRWEVSAVGKKSFNSKQ